MEQPIKKLEKIKLKELNPYLTCHLCKGYLIDATTISECLHSFCRSCIIKFLQENSHCPVCEVIINKAKPNLKLDKTLQDVVYKLVPELFLREMTRRKLYYQQYPEIAARVSPEERGEDTERTIFNPQDCISLSLEFISDDSTPGAITLFSKNGLNTADKQLGDTEDTQTLMKRYLQCPGMCRIEVLKKFVRNKYNVDTSKFYIDILYKKVPLPDHYTLIDIAYIYTWRRNEPMKFYFRITDVNKDADSCGDSTPQKSISLGKTPTRTPKVSVDRSAKKRESIRQKNTKANQTRANLFNKLKKEVLTPSPAPRKVDSPKRLIEKSKTSDNRNSSAKAANASDSENANEITSKAEVIDKIVNGSCKLNETKVENGKDTSSVNSNSGTKLVDKNVSEKCKPSSSDDSKVSYKITSVGANLENNNNINITIKKERSPIKPEADVSSTEPSELQKEASKQEPVKEENDPSKNQNLMTTDIADRLGTKTLMDDVKSGSYNGIESIEDIKNNVLKSEAVEQNKTPSDKSDSKNAVYTSITLNRSNNMEIITKIQKVSNKEGQAIGLNIIKQTVQKSAKVENRIPKQVLKIECDKGPAVKEEPETKSTSNGTDKSMKPTTPVNDRKPCIKAEAHEVKSPSAISSSDNEDEKLKFLRCMELTAKDTVQDAVQKQNTPNVLAVQSSTSQKRKNSSPIKNDKSKKMKIDGRKSGTTRIIIQPKVHPQIPSTTAPVKTTGLQSIIENCKIPSSLSITIKEGNEASRLPPLVPPVKNYIEILKLPDESTKASEKPAVTSSSGAKFNFSTICDNDSEQKVDEDLSEIARSLTEKIPMSTTISQIVGPKPQYPIPVKSSTPAKLTILPSPVPEILPSMPTPAPSKALTLPKDNLNPRSPQTFQKIFEESIKRPDVAKSPEKDTSQKSALDLSDASATSNNSKRNILEIASKLYKKTKMEQEKSNPEAKVDEPTLSTPSLPKVPIPRLSNHRYMKPQTKIKNVKFEVADPTKYTQTLANLHSNALGLNYTISVGHNLNQNGNGMLQTPKKEEIKTTTVRVIPPSSSFTPPKESASSSPKPSPIPKISPGLGLQSPKSSPKHSPKSSPIIKHMYAPVPSLMMDQHRVQSYTPKIPSPKPASPKLPLPGASPTLPLASPSLKSSTSSSPKPSSSSPKPSPKATDISHPLLIKAPSSSKSREASSPSSTSNATKPLSVNTPSSSSKNSPKAKSSPKAGSSQTQNSPLSPNQILEKYNIQNLAQLTASLNFNPATFGLNPSNQLAALQHAMLLKHFEMQNRQNWLANLNQGPLLQYEKYLQSLKANQNPLLGNIKEN